MRYSPLFILLFAISACVEPSSDRGQITFNGDSAETDVETDANATQIDKERYSEDGTAPSDPKNPNNPENPNHPNNPDNPSNPDNPGDPDAPLNPPKVLNLNYTSIRQLPFRVLRNKLITSLDLSASQQVSLLSELNTLKENVGAYNYANGINQQLLWSSSKLVSWLNGLTPVCIDASVRGQLSDKQASLDLLLKAWGREAEAEEIADLDTLFNDTSIGLAKKQELACLYIFSSLEFIAL